MAYDFTLSHATLPRLPVQSANCISRSAPKLYTLTVVRSKSRKMAAYVTSARCSLGSMTSAFRKPRNNRLKKHIGHTFPPVTERRELTQNHVLVTPVGSLMTYIFKHSNVAFQLLHRQFERPQRNMPLPCRPLCESRSRHPIPNHDEALVRILFALRQSKRHCRMLRHLSWPTRDFRKDLDNRIVIVLALKLVRSRKHRPRHFETSACAQSISNNLVRLWDEFQSRIGHSMSLRKTGPHRESYPIYFSAQVEVGNNHLSGL